MCRKLQTLDYPGLLSVFPTGPLFKSYGPLKLFCWPPWFCGPLLDLYDVFLRYKDLSLKCNIFVTNPTTANIQHTNPKMDHRPEEANKPHSSGHNFYKRGPVEKPTTALDTPLPIVLYIWVGFPRTGICPPFFGI